MDGAALWIAVVPVGGPESCPNVLHSIDVTVILCPTPVSVSHSDSSRNALAAHFCSLLLNETTAIQEVDRIVCPQ